MNRGKILISPEMLMEVLLLNNLYDFEYISMSEDENHIELIVRGESIPGVMVGDDLPILMPVYLKQEPLIIKEIQVMNK